MADHPMQLPWYIWGCGGGLIADGLMRLAAPDMPWWLSVGYGVAALITSLGLEVHRHHKGLL